LSKRIEKISQRLQFQQILRRGRKISGKSLNLFIAPKPDSGLACGLVIGKKIKRAVDRNRIKRLAREVVRLHRSELRPGLYLIIHIANAQAPRTFSGVEGELMRLFSAANILVPSHDPA
jgi:ribonuclease P protein component